MLKSRHKKYFLITLLVAVFSLSAAPSVTKIVTLRLRRIHGSRYIPLSDITKSFKIESSYNIITMKGKLYHKRHSAVFGVGLRIMIIDGLLFLSDKRVIRSRGAVLLPVDSAEKIIHAFYQKIQIRRKDRKLFVRFGLKRNHGLVKKKDLTSHKHEKREKISFIVIDPGHGGKDPGAIGRGGLREKKITLRLALNLYKILRKRLRKIKVILTRKKDVFIELGRRTEIANRLLKKNENGIFISVHINASITNKISGIETYFLSQNPTNEDARTTAALENNVVVLEENRGRRKKFSDIDYIEATMMTTQIQKESALLAKSIQQGIIKRTKKSTSRGVKKADFFVLRGVLMPAVLLEAGFITNKREARYLQNKSYLKEIAKGTADGVMLFIRRYNRMLKRSIK